MRTRLFPFLLLTLILFGMVFVGAAKPVAAAGCSGQGCNGGDAFDTGCASSAYTARSRDVVFETAPPNPFRLVARVEMRWSTSCQTNWAKATIIEYSTSTAPYMEVVLKDSSDHEIKGNNWTTYWAVSGWGLYGNMYYAPNIPVKACVYLSYAGVGSGWQCTAYG